MPANKFILKEPASLYAFESNVQEGLKKIEHAVKHGLNKRSRLYNDVIHKHRKAWETLANL